MIWGEKMPLDSYEICCGENAPSSDEIYWGKRYGNKNVKMILRKKCPYVVMKFVGAKSWQPTYP